MYGRRCGEPSRRLIVFPKQALDQFRSCGAGRWPHGHLVLQKGAFCSHGALTAAWLRILDELDAGLCNDPGIAHSGPEFVSLLST